MEQTLTSRHRTLILMVVAFALMMVVSAVSGLNVALPDLAVDTGASQTQVTWVVDAYTLAFVGLLLPAGALGDRFGRRRALLAGLSTFGAAAATAMFVQDPTVLLG
jgi:MFS family permease